MLPNPPLSHDFVVQPATPPYSLQVSADPQLFVEITAGVQIGASAQVQLLFSSAVSDD